MERINKSFGLSLIGFNENQTDTFLAILSLAERGLQHSWRVVDMAHADFFILAAEKSLSEPLIAAKNLPPERCLFCSEQDLSGVGVLTTDSRGVPRLGSLVGVLNQAINTGFSEPALPISIVEPNKVITSAGDNDFFDPEWGFLQHLLRNETGPLVFSFNRASDSNKLYVNPVEKVYFCETSLKDLSLYLITDDAIVINAISEIAWHNEVKQMDLPAKPLSNLIWYVAFKLSNGRLLRGHSSQDSVYLTRWPDLGIQDCGKYVKLAAFMRNNAVPLTVIAAKTATPLIEVYNFYNACYLIGIIEKTPEPELHTKILDEDKQILLTKITSRLKEIDSRKER